MLLTNRYGSSAYCTSHDLCGPVDDLHSMAYYAVLTPGICPDILRFTDIMIIVSVYLRSDKKMLHLLPCAKLILDRHNLACL